MRRRKERVPCRAHRMGTMYKAAGPNPNPLAEAHLRVDSEVHLLVGLEVHLRADSVVDLRADSEVDLRAGLARIHQQLQQGTAPNLRPLLW